jgi:photosystem II stability/assembly factor-like uncharacterized protein
MLAVTSCTGSHTSPPAVIANQRPAQIEWLLGPGALLNAVAFAGPGAGAAVGELGAILVTSDAGVTWKAAESGTDQSLRGVAFADATNGVVVGAGGTVLRTADGGHTWTAMRIGSTAELRAVAFGGPGVAVIVGESGTVLRTEDGGGAWKPVASGTTSTLRAVRFASPSVAVAAGDDGALVRSTDGGLTWASLESGTSAALRGLHFVTATTGVVVGGDDRRWRAERVVLRTTDAGATWTKTSVPRGGRLYAATRASDGTIVAVGEAGASIRSSDQGLTWQVADAVKGTDNTSNWFASVASAGPALVAVSYGGRIFRSTDGGVGWTSANQTPDHTAAIARAGDGALVIGTGSFIFRFVGAKLEKTKSESLQVRGIRFLDSLVGVAVGSKGTIQRTVDGGKTWATVESGTKRDFLSVAFSDRNHGIAVAAGSGSGAGMVRTEDGGLTWHAQPCVGGTSICTTASPLWAVSMLSSQVGMAVGARGVVIKTIDGGRSWTQLKHGLTTGTLWGVTLLDATTAFAVGYPGVILHTRDGGATWALREAGAPRGLARVAFIDALHGLIVGQGGTILTTADGGFTWRRELTRTTRDLWDMMLDATGTALIAAAPGPGVVLRYTWATTAEAPAANTARGGSRE